MPEQRIRKAEKDSYAGPFTLKKTPLNRRNLIATAESLKKKENPSSIGLGQLELK
ncbi:hypothetical protein LEP1GSC021_0300 [Leptospira noguchii str. 1993005606]|uniref:Uncharacterized protein n=2 Tax=Leptospira noguchii TaxID=28182 RepID=M6YFJ4_9LEPT|nr:hypothetical protein LEP1GSC072_4231 [Leptospira noguchii str. Bonito]EMN02602.1 hypothetical protein LEP1GSC035_2559 [Leptospira noguchii str. 2007001578]EMO90626.1 hypothetical protein LEP1GSC024_4338 [Leptospira noguchii str. 2001034031]EPE84937.1 hypothetical protein LEP1GSC021_0300 [Leptospira noguchii str. 1993005606]